MTATTAAPSVPATVHCTVAAVEQGSWTVAHITGHAQMPRPIKPGTLSVPTGEGLPVETLGTVVSAIEVPVPAPVAAA